MHYIVIHNLFKNFSRIIIYQESLKVQNSNIIQSDNKDINNNKNLNIRDYFREASWSEAIELSAKNLNFIYNENGSHSICGFGSAKGSNEEAYLFQKLIRTAFKTNNVDHCTRLCHASSVAALLETIGSGAVTAPFYEVEHSEVIIVIGLSLIHI